LRDNGRITVMFCAFSGQPNILRLFGTGRVVPLGDPEFVALAARFPARPGARAVIVVDVRRVQNSCGYAVPLHEFVGERDLLEKWADARAGDRLTAYRAEKNASSIDGLPAYDPA
jgi:hypothetical protein